MNNEAVGGLAAGRAWLKARLGFCSFLTNPGPEVANSLVPVEVI